MFAHLASLSMVDWINFVLANCALLVVIGATNKMDRQTEKTIIIAFATIGAGLVGYILGTIFPGHWEKSFDTLLVGGVLALLIGSRKRTVWIAPELMPRISFAASGVTWGAFLLLMKNA